MSASLFALTLIRILPPTLVLLLGLSWFTQQSLQQQLQQQTQNDLNQHSRHGALAISYELKQLQQTSLLLANNPLLINSLIDLNSQQNLLQPLLESASLPGPIPAQVYLFDYRGRPLLNSSDKTYPNSAWLALVMQGEALLKLSEQGLILAQPVYIGGLAEAALVIEYPPQALSAWLANLQLGSIALINEKNDILVNQLQPSEAIDQVFASQPSSQWLSAVVEIPGFKQLKLVGLQSSLELKQALAHIEQTLYSYLAITVLALILSIAITAWMLGQPLRQLAKALSNYKDTMNFKQPLSSSGPKEINLVIRAFNALASELQQKHINSVTDEETQLANQREFEQVLEREFYSVKRHQTSLSLALIELDQFEQLEHQLSHEQIVHYLRQIGQQLKNQCRRQQQDLVARFGPHSFAVILPNTNHPEQFAEQLRFQLERFNLDPDPIKVQQITASIGLASIYPCHNQHDTSQLLKSAQIGLYRAKKRGGNQVACISVSSLYESKRQVF